MIDEFFKWAFGAGIAQGLFLIMGLLSVKVRDERTKLLLIALLSTYTLLLIEEFFEILGINLGLALGVFMFSLQFPVFYLFVSRITSHSFPLGRAHLWHALPFAVFGVGYVILRLVFWGQHFSANNPALAPVAVVLTLAKLGVVIGYLAASFRRLVNAEPRSRERRTSLRWLFWGLVVVCVLMVVDGLAFALVISAWENAPDSDRISGIMMALAVYGLGYLALARRELLESERVEVEYARDDMERFLTDARQAIQASGLHELQNPGPDDLARALNKPVDEVRPVIETAFPGGLRDLVNEVRLDQVAALLTSQDRRDRSILDLALEAGFQSKPSFYRLFKARFGCSPKVYREQSQTSH